MKTSDYLAQVRRNMGNWNNASGNTGNFKNASGGNLMNRPGTMGRNTPGWNASGQSDNLQPSDPLIIQITNNSTDIVGPFSIFGAAKYLYGNYGGGTWDADGNLTIDNVTISCLYESITYQQFLVSTQNNPFSVGSVYMEVTDGPTQQASDVYSLTSQSPSGDLYTKPIKPYKDQYQFQNGVTYNTKAFNIGALTQITWKKIYASVSFQISFFPFASVDPGAVLSGNSATQGFARPNVIGNLRAPGSR